ncbi:MULTISPECIES: DUF485 domain-containing protein [unclassified Nocardiopsis]|uniref:DUF485 domain-containing protein n=1 Tax=Nocardiopsis TaxID=2013 RepID=UPI00387B40F1
MATKQPPEPPAEETAAPLNGGLSEADVIAMHSDPKFLLLKQRLYRFIFPMSLAFMAWYLLYVFMSAFARDLMSTPVLGQFNLALVFGVLQFVTTFGIAILYSSYSRKNLDPAAADVRNALEEKAEDR